MIFCTSESCHTKRMQKYLLILKFNNNVQTWTNVQLLESALKHASIDSAPTNVTASTATKRFSKWESYEMSFRPDKNVTFSITFTYD